MFMLTRLGHEARQQGKRASAWVRARRRLGVELHPVLAPRLRALVEVGAFEQAALVALRAVEARVRTLTGKPPDQRGTRLTGVPLMRRAFGDGGRFAASFDDAGERVGTMELFTGTFGAVRNVIAHTEVEWSDSVEAAEYVLLADLLMRILDRLESATGSA
jgi:uncharacterized protein (TIGR02391 family)